MTAGTPSAKVIAGVAVALLGCVLVAIAIHEILQTGTCSSTGYTQYGPAPHCPKGSGWYGAFLTGGILLTVASGIFVGWSYNSPALFLAIGVGSLLVAFSPSPSAGVVFPALFGGGFVVGGLVWAAYSWNARPIRPRTPAPPVSAPAIPAIAGLGGPVEPARPRLPRIGLRPVIAAVVWAAVVAGGLELGHLVAKDAGTSTSSVDVTRAPLPRPAGEAAAVGAASPASMFRLRSLEGALDDLTVRFGSDISVVALAIYPGQLDVVVAENGSARLVTATSAGATHVGPAVPFEGSRQAVDLSQVHADVPERLAGEIAARGGVPAARLDRFVLDLSGPLAGWRIYPAGGGARFTARLTGGDLERVTAQGKQPLDQ